jgi:hypothetical protein
MVTGITIGAIGPFNTADMFLLITTEQPVGITAELKSSLFDLKEKSRPPTAAAIQYQRVYRWASDRRSLWLHSLRPLEYNHG